jgi:glucose 1-dehydrogenase
MVLENDVILESVNANRTHYETGAAALQRADRTWRSRLISRRVLVHDWRKPFVGHRDDDVKIVRGFGTPS